MPNSQDVMLYYCSLFCSLYIYAKFTRYRAMLLWPFFGLLSMPNSQDTVLDFCGFSLVLYLCPNHKMSCFVIVAFICFFIYVKLTHFQLKIIQNQMLSWKTHYKFGIRLFEKPLDAVLCYCGISLVYYLCHVKFTRRCALLLWPFFGLLSMSSSQDTVLCYCGFSLVYYQCQVHKTRVATQYPFQNTLTFHWPFSDFQPISRPFWKANFSHFHPSTIQRFCTNIWTCWFNL